MHPKRPSSGFFSKIFHWGCFVYVPPLIGPKRVVKSGGPARSKRVRRLGKRDQWVRRGLPRSSPTTPSATLKVRRPQFAAAGREAASRVHYATHSAAWHTNAWGVIGGTGCDWGWVDCMRGCRATSPFRSAGKGGEGRREGGRGRGGGRGRERGKKGGRTGMERQAFFPYLRRCYRRFMHGVKGRISGAERRCPWSPTARCVAGRTCASSLMKHAPCCATSIDVILVFELDGLFKGSTEITEAEGAQVLEYMTSMFELAGLPIPTTCMSAKGLAKRSKALRSSTQQTT